MFIYVVLYLSCKAYQHKAKTSSLTTNLKGMFVITWLCLLFQVVGSSMQLIGDHQAEDRQLISEVVLAKMNQVLPVRSSSASRSPVRSPQGQKPTTVQPQQVTTKIIVH